MRVLFDLTSLAHNFSGIERYALCVSQELIRQYPQNRYILVFKNAIHDAFRILEEQGNVTCVVLRGGNKLLFNQIRLPLALYRIKADTYFFLAFPEPILFFKKNMNTAIHDAVCWDCAKTMPILKRLYFRMSYRKSMAFCRQIITVSEFSKARLISIGHIPSDRIVVAHSGISSGFSSAADDRAEVLEKYQLPTNYILTLSTLEPRKNLPLLLEAYEKALLKADLPDLVLVGRMGWMMEKYFSNLSDEIKQRVRFTGFVVDEDLPAIYRQASFFVFPSKYEGFGLPPLEAMACGTPVLSSDAASMPEILGNAAVYFHSEDACDLANKLRQIVSLPQEEYSQLVARGIQRANFFSWGKSASILAELISESCRGK